MGEVLFFHFWVTNVKLINEKNPLNVTVWMFKCYSGEHLEIDNTP